MLILRRVPRRGAHLSAGIAAAETTAALSLAHLAAGGPLPHGAWLLAIAAVAYGAGLLVLRRRAPIRLVWPALVALQVLMHAWLAALSAGPHHHADHGAVLGLTWPMLLAHVVAGSVAALAWALRRRAVDLLLGWHREARLLITGPATVAGAAQPRPQGHLLRVAPARGPPRLLVAAA